MKASGIIRKIDQLGRVVVPKELRNLMDIKEVCFFIDKHGFYIESFDPKVHRLAIHRTIDPLGRITIASEIRRRFNWDIGQPLEIFTEQNRIYFVEYHNFCAVCREGSKLIPVKSKHLCYSCVQELLRNKEVFISHSNRF
ncbi:hypothetical protein [Fictibacillus sp. NRS-1165]|uniref:AbrB/MazE/SpoVT family DNA-binding domain-containing protein n=1 Tax=Fictibacillus sp. NRS-1165 TaxID=3144463 RepID=UPI003D1CEEA3